MLHFKSIKLLILCVITLVFLFTGACSLDTHETDIQTDDETAVNGRWSWSSYLRKRAASQYYTPNGSLLQTWSGRNCHAFAWQKNCGIPTVLPNYHLETPSPFWWDGSFKLIAVGNINAPLPANVQVGDKVIYSNNAHSAVVYSINSSSPLFISYKIGATNFKVHPPNDSYVTGYGSALSFYRISNSSFCSIPNPTTPQNPANMVIIRSDPLLMERREDDYIYYARMLNSNDNWRFRWNLDFYDAAGRWVGSWERRETTKNASQHTGIYFFQNYPSATKMIVRLTVTNIYGRGFYQVSEVRYKP